MLQLMPKKTIDKLTRAWSDVLHAQQKTVDERAVPVEDEIDFDALIPYCTVPFKKELEASDMDICVVKSNGSIL